MDITFWLLDGDAYKKPRKGKNNDKAHPPIHPLKDGADLTGDDLKVYQFIAKRFLACCSKDALGESTLVEFQISSETFVANGVRVIERNFLEIYSFQTWNSNEIPQFRLGERLVPSSLLFKVGRTTPPKLLTEADLIAMMDLNGIGTDATIHEHINKILEREYIFKRPNGGLEPSSLGIALVEGYDSIGFDISLSKPFLRAKVLEAEFRWSLR